MTFFRPSHLLVVMLFCIYQGDCGQQHGYKPYAKNIATPNRYIRTQPPYQPNVYRSPGSVPKPRQEPQPRQVPQPRQEPRPRREPQPRQVPQHSIPRTNPEAEHTTRRRLVRPTRRPQPEKPHPPRIYEPRSGVYGGRKDGHQKPIYPEVVNLPAGRKDNRSGKRFSLLICLNGGTKITSQDGDKCQCAKGFKGRSCGLIGETSSKFTQWIQDNSKTIIIVLATLVILMLISMFIMCCCCCGQKGQSSQQRQKPKRPQFNLGVKSQRQPTRTCARRPQQEEEEDCSSEEEYAEDESPPDYSPPRQVKAKQVAEIPPEAVFLPKSQYHYQTTVRKI